MTPMAIRLGYETEGPVHIITGDALTELRRRPDESVQCVVTSPPYWGLRDYGVSGQMGLEATPELYVERLVGVFREVRRVLRKDGTLWLNLGDSYAGSWGAQSRPNGNDAGSTLQGGSMLSARQIEAHPKGQTHTGSLKNTPGLKAKDLVGIPWMVAFALRADGWWLRSDNIWSKPNPMPESVTDRPTKAHEYLFLLTRSERYYYDAEAIKEPGTYAGPNGAQHSPYGQGFTRRTPEQEVARQDKQRGHSRRHAGFNDRWDGMTRAEQSSLGRNKRSVWEIATQPYPEAHFATFPEALVEPCIKAGSREGDTVLDPFAGSGTTLAVARRLGRKAIGIELQPDYLPLILERVREAAMPLLEALSGEATI
jgi:DNA modification methylase